MCFFPCRSSAGVGWIWRSDGAEERKPADGEGEAQPGDPDPSDETGPDEQWRSLSWGSQNLPELLLASNSTDNCGCFFTNHPPPYTSDSILDCCSNAPTEMFNLLAESNHQGALLLVSFYQVNRKTEKPLDVHHSLKKRSSSALLSTMFSVCPMTDSSTMWPGTSIRNTRRQLSHIPSCDHQNFIYLHYCASWRRHIQRHKDVETGASHRASSILWNCSDELRTDSFNGNSTWSLWWFMMVC